MASKSKVVIYPNLNHFWRKDNRNLPDVPSQLPGLTVVLLPPLSVPLSVMDVINIPIKRF